MTPFRNLFLIVVAICTAVAIGAAIASRLHPEWVYWNYMKQVPNPRR